MPVPPRNGSRRWDTVFRVIDCQLSDHSRTKTAGVSPGAAKAGQRQRGSWGCRAMLLHFAPTYNAYTGGVLKRRGCRIPQSIAHPSWTEVQIPALRVTPVTVRRWTALAAASSAR